MKTSVSLLFLVALALSACQPATTLPTAILESPSAIAPVTETATFAPPTATSTVNPNPLDFPLAVCCLGTPLDPGTYRLPAWMGMNFTIVVPPDWRVIHDDTLAAFAITRGENSLNESSQFIQFNVMPAVITLADFQQDVLDSPEFIFQDPQEVNVAGFFGFEVDAQANPNPNEIGSREEHIAPGTQHITVLEDNLGGFWVTSTPEAKVRFTAIDVNGIVLLIFFEAENSQFDQFLEDAEAMVASMVFVP